MPSYMRVVKLSSASSISVFVSSDMYSVMLLFKNCLKDSQSTGPLVIEGLRGTGRGCVSRVNRTGEWSEERSYRLVMFGIHMNLVKVKYYKFFTFKLEIFFIYN